MEIAKIEDKELLKEIGRRFDEKASSIEEMEFLTKKLMELNEKSKNAQEVKSQFLSLVKNEFNNPISSLLNITAMLSNAKDLSKINSLGMMLQQELIKIDFSMKNIFAASEIEAGETSNDYNKVNIEHIYNEVIEYFDQLVKEKNLSLEFEKKCDKNIISDSHKIYLILLNLISNACEYSYNNSSVHVNLACDDEHFTIVVKDYGEGIKKEHSKEIFNRFIHFETGETRATAGLGLGLSVARGMCEALDGSIDNVKEDGATVFIVKIPLLDESAHELSTAFGSNEFMFDNNTSDDGMMEF